MPWKPSEAGERPTLGWEMIDWYIDNLACPDRADYEPFVPTKEQAQFILNFYEIKPQTGKRKIRRAILSRARGWGKSPLLAAMAIGEACGPCVPDGWDANGQPVGKPWSSIRTPLVQVAAVSELQTKNSWDPLLEMIRDGPIMDQYDIDPMDTFVSLPKGRIERLTSSAHTVKGNRPVFAVMDQTEEWTRSNGGHRLSETMLDNATKVGGSTIESPNAYTPGVDSVAETTAAAYHAMKAGKTRMPDGLLYDHREASATTDLTDHASLLKSLKYVYGDSADSAGGWVDLEGVIARIWDPDMPAQLARADFLNQITHAPDAWISNVEWSKVAHADIVVRDGEQITLGFDGSVRDDSTALAACRVSDGHIWLMDCWEKPMYADKDWQVDRTLVDYAVEQAFVHFNVVAFYADPPFWADYLDRWQQMYGSRVLVKATATRVFEWWTNRPRAIVDALDRFYEAVAQERLSHDGGSTLRGHVLNARRRMVPAGTTIAKEHPSSDRKIDAAMAAVLAYEARADAIAMGIGATQFYIPKRLDRSSR